MWIEWTMLTLIGPFLASSFFKTNGFCETNVFIASSPISDKMCETLDTCDQNLWKKMKLPELGSEIVMDLS